MIIMRKFSELEEDERHRLEDELDSKAEVLGLNTYNSYESRSSFNSLEQTIGICSNCKNLQYCRTEFNNVFARCSEFEIKLNGQNKVTECTFHNAKGTLSLSDMENIAILIDPSESKIKGFISNDPKLRKKS